MALFWEILDTLFQLFFLWIAGSAAAQGYAVASRGAYYFVAFLGLGMAAFAGSKDEKYDKIGKWKYLILSILYIASIVMTIIGVKEMWWLSIVAVIQGMCLIHFWHKVEMDDF